MGSLYVEYEYAITFAQLVMAMFAMGATLHLRDFRAVLVLPRSFLTGLGAQLVLVPILATVCAAAGMATPEGLIQVRFSYMHSSLTFVV